VVIRVIVWSEGSLLSQEWSKLKIESSVSFGRSKAGREVGGKDNLAAELDNFKLFIFKIIWKDKETMNRIKQYMEMKIRKVFFITIYFSKMVEL